MKLLIVGILLLTFFISFTVQFDYLNLTISNLPSSSEDDLKFNNPEEIDKEFANIKVSYQKMKRASCFAIIRNALSSGNTIIKQAIKDSKTDKSKTFDKIILLMLENCEKTINQEQITKFLTPENILTIDENLISLIYFSPNIFLDPFYEITFVGEEKEILKEINNIFPSDESELSIEIENSSKNEKFKFIGIGAVSMLIFYIFISLLKYFLRGKTKEFIGEYQKKNKFEKIK